MPPGWGGDPVVRVLILTRAPLSPALAAALPAEAAALAQELRRIPAVSVAVVNLQYEGVALPVTVRAAAPRGGPEGDPSTQG